MAILIAILLLLASGCYAIWDTAQVYSEADASQYEAYKPTEGDEGMSFAELVKLNPEVFAWLTVYGTHIDYPVAQGPNNTKYINTNAEGEYALSGAIFLDSGCSRDFSDFNNIIYGHHMEKEAMFGEIGSFSDAGFFEARRYGALYYGGGYHGIEFFAFLKTDGYDREVYRTGVKGIEEERAYVDMLLGKSIHVRDDVELTEDDRIVLLSTCSPVPTNGRDILVGRLTNEVYADGFAIGESEAPAGAAILFGTWSGLPLWVWIVIIAAVILIVLLLIRARKKKRVE
jgi:sortase B